MREIKFRAWHVNKKVMFSCQEMVVDQMCLLPDGRFINVSGMDTRLSKIDNTGIMIPLQYTGIKDKNGKEIYEGDILGPMPNDYKDEYKGNWKVVYHDGAYFGEDADGHHITWVPYWTEEQFEVLGNIHENPELLKELS